jgi:glycosyltransferase involved in cell wall biosynthesis
VPGSWHPQMVDSGQLPPLGPASGTNPGSIGEVVIINDFAKATGGATIIALQEARELQRLGYKVTYICGDSPSPELAALGVEQVALGSLPLLEQPAWRAMADGLHNSAALRMIADWIARRDTPRTVYHLHNWSQILSPAVFDALKPVERRLVVTCHDFFNSCPNGGFTHYAKSSPCAARPLSVQCLTSQCDRRSALQKYWRTLRQVRLKQLADFGQSQASFTFLHERMQEKFIASAFPARHLLTLRNPVEAWTDRRIEAERNHGFIFVGRIGPDKGTDLAIGAASAAGQNLTIIGPGEIAVPSPHGSSRIETAGWCDRAEIASLASRARAIVVPSRVVEPFGLVLLEAAMSGLPVIVSDHAYLADEARELGFAMTFSISRPDELADLVSRLASDDELIARMSWAGFERAHRLCHSPASWTEQLTELFGQKLARAHDVYP